jgi:hypothetical protein
VGTKRPWGQNVRRTKRPSGSYLPGPCWAIFKDKNLLSVNEKSTNTYPLSVGGWEGDMYSTVLNTEVLYIYQNSLHPYHVTLLKCTILHFFRLGYFFTIQDNVYSLSIVQCILIMSTVVNCF